MINIPPNSVHTNENEFIRIFAIEQQCISELQTYLLPNLKGILNGLTEKSIDYNNLNISSPLLIPHYENTNTN